MIDFIHTEEIFCLVILKSLTIFHFNIFLHIIYYMCIFLWGKIFFLCVRSFEISFDDEVILKKWKRKWRRKPIQLALHCNRQAREPSPIVQSAHRKGHYRSNGRGGMNLLLSGDMSPLSTACHQQVASYSLSKQWRVLTKISPKHFGSFVHGLIERMSCLNPALIREKNKIIVC